MYINIAIADAGGAECNTLGTHLVFARRGAPACPQLALFVAGKCYSLLREGRCIFVCCLLLQRATSVCGCWNASTTAPPVPGSRRQPPTGAASGGRGGLARALCLALRSGGGCCMCKIVACKLQGRGVAAKFSRLRRSEGGGAQKLTKPEGCAAATAVVYCCRLPAG